MVATEEHAADSDPLLRLYARRRGHRLSSQALYDHAHTRRDPITVAFDASFAARVGQMGDAPRYSGHRTSRTADFHLPAPPSSLTQMAGKPQALSRPSRDQSVDALRDHVAQAVTRWHMLAGVRRLGVGLSGGADSLAMFDALASLELPVDLVPLHVHQHPRHQDPARLSAFVQEAYGRSTEVIHADTSAAANRAVALGKAPCRVCAPVRAERLGKAARALDLDAVALGHHLDDAAATLLMNIFHTGAVDTMRPVARRREHLDIPILRPMLLITEKDVKDAAPTPPEGLFNCGMCSEHAVERARASRFVADMFGTHRPAAAHLASLVASLAEEGRAGGTSRGRRTRR